MREFAEAFDADSQDRFALSAKGLAQGLHLPWNRMLLRAREAGCEIIDNWDVRRVGKLIELLPECVPAKFRGGALRCYMADNEAADWIVEIDELAPAARPKSSLSM